MRSAYIKQKLHTHQLQRSSILAAAAFFLSAVYGISLGLSISPLVLIAAPVALVVGVLALAKPEYAAAVLLVVEWGFISDILVNIHGVPSISKALVALLLCVLLFHRFSRQRVPLLYDSAIWWMLAYWLVTCLGLWYAPDPNRTLPLVIDVAKQIIMVVVLVNLLKTIHSFKVAMWLLLAVGALLGTLTVYQEVTQSYNSDFGGLARMEIGQISEDLQDRPRAAGTTGSPLAYGQQLVVLIPLGLWAMLQSKSPTPQLAAAYALAAIVAGVGLSFSRSIYIAAAVVLVAYVLHLRLSPRYLLLLVPLMGALLWVAPPEFTARVATLESLLPAEGNEGVRSEASFNRRSVEMLMAVMMFVDHPVAGVGGGNYPELYPEYIRATGSPVPDEERTPHSFYLEVVAEHGIIGFLAWSGILLITWERLRAASRLFRTAGNQHMAELAVALRIGFLGYLATAVFYHGAYPQFLWLQVGMALALAAIARRSSAALPGARNRIATSPAFATR